MCHVVVAGGDRTLYGNVVLAQCLTQIKLLRKHAQWSEAHLHIERRALLSVSVGPRTEISECTSPTPRTVKFCPLTGGSGLVSMEYTDTAASA